MRNVQFKSDAMLTSGDAKLDEEILEALKKCGAGSHTGRDITRKGGRFLREAGQVKIDRHLASLSKSGYIQMVQVVRAKGGKPVIKYEMAEEK